jgi:hypothetical protein
MEKRVRSPNYPALSLPMAIEKVAALYRAQHTHAAPREIVARSMGHNSLNGASASAISAVQKYGLLAKVGEGLKISDRALRILHPHSAGEKAEAIREAAYEPSLFAELRDRFSGRMPSEDLLKNYLIRKGFAPAALTAVIAAYRETSEMAESAGEAHDSLCEQQQELFDMPPSVNDPTIRVRPAAAAQPQPTQPSPIIAMMEDHFIVNMVVRSRAKAKALRHMIEMAEQMLPEEDTKEDARKAPPAAENDEFQMTGPDEDEL